MKTNQKTQRGIEINQQTNKILRMRGFPGGVVVESPPANAGDVGLNPGPGRSHMPRSSWARVPQLLSLSSGACEPQLLSPYSTTTEGCAPRACAPPPQ